MERRKTRVRTVAERLFARHGYEDTTVSAIAKKSHVCSRTIHKHIGNKDEIFRQAVLAMSTLSMPDPLRDFSGSLSESLAHAAQYCYDTTRQARTVDLIRLLIAESGRFPDLMSQVATEIFTRLQGNLSVLFQQLAAQKVIPHGDHDQSAELFVDLLLGNQTVMFYFGWLPSPPTKTDIKVKVDLFIRGRFGPQ
ncbi:TetR/AcrR family transcriptional regulator [Novosphingobium sp. G106]|uniref:TetR/AcrR family transcriptional regulator n=1 Tax=Novosphingobium sp. G106 TaxID=2849500 RepID=UPI001C2D4B8C|nr:TetR/AcrR family transcriptional regulator [Novosphingobium sp. G106]MBV1686244.1 TetR/AcrR family transcriptional regulator [Novosphingobium sp. G106]